MFHLQDVCVRVQKGMRHRLRTAALQRAPQIEATFRWLQRRGVAIYLLSDYGRADTNIILQRMKWPVGSDELIRGVVLKAKSCANPVEKVLQCVDAPDAKRTVVVSDTPGLIKAAARVGVTFNLAVTSGKHTRQDLQDTSCRVLLEDTVELIRYLLECLPRLSEVALTADSTHAPPFRDLGA